MRALVGTRFGNVEIRKRAVHRTKDGRSLLVTHGDEFDALIECGALAMVLGSLAYRSLLNLNRLVHWINDRAGKPYWSLAQRVKSRIGGASRYVERFRRASTQAARDAGLDGVVCGHIHEAEVRHVDGLLYCNDGDWVESCTALVEDRAGKLSLRQFASIGRDHRTAGSAIRQAA
jgi:UDP-2,3-diacylglucosamine pyrophosphatase LpxH